MKTTHQDNGIIRDEQENIVGINLGWDFTAEHEWGIKDLQHTLDSAHETDGPDRFLIINADRVIFSTTKFDGEEWSVIGVHRGDDIDMIIGQLPNPHDDEEVVAAWAGYGFVVATKNKEAFDLIKTAITTSGVVLTLSKLFASEASAFGNSGMKLIARSSIPKEWEELWIQSHVDSRELTEAATQTGIADRLAEAGKRYYALSPRWEDDAKTKVIFWLNPIEQDKNNYGWFDVETLDAWIRNEGPIPIK